MPPDNIELPPYAFYRRFTYSGAFSVATSLLSGKITERTRVSWPVSMLNKETLALAKRVSCRLKLHSLSCAALATVSNPPESSDADGRE